MNNTITKVGDNFTTGSSCRFLVSEARSSLYIGDDCLFSNNITVRTEEVSHLIFDAKSGEFIGGSHGVCIGNHVWVGESVYVGKKAAIPDGCILGAYVMVTRKFREQDCVIAGNPAKVVKKGIKWVVNRGSLEDDSGFAKSFDEYCSNRMRLPAEFQEKKNS